MLQLINVGTFPDDGTGDPLRTAYIKINEMFEFDVYPVLPTVDQKAALAGTYGFPSDTNRYVTEEDPRNTNARIPTGPAGGDLTGTYPNPTINLKAITLEKMADMPQNTIIGRIDPGTGVPQYLTAPNVKTILGIGDVPETFLDLIDTPSSYTGHGSKIIAIKADESGLEFVASGATYTDENAQDAIGGILDNGTLGDINFTYADATPTIHGIVKNSSITNAKLANVNSGIIKGRVSPGSGVVEDLTGIQVRNIIDVYSKSEVNTLLSGLTFLGLTDTPSSYSGHGGKLVAVNAGATALEFITASGSYSDEQAQDAIGTILDDGTNGDIIFSYNDSAPRIDATIKNSAVTYAKIQNVTGDRLLGREGAAGVVQEISLGAGLSLAGGVLSSTGGAGTTTFLGLTDTPSSYTGHAGKFVAVNSTPDGLEFRNLIEADIPALSAYYLSSNPSNYISANQTITLSGAVTGNGTTSIATTLSNSIVQNANIRNSIGLSVIGRSASSTGVVSDITAANDHEVLRRSGSSIGFGLITGNNITLANGQIFIGNSSNVATAVAMSGHVTISNTGVVTIANDSVDFTKTQNISTSRILGRASVGAGDIEQLTGTQATALLDVFTSGLKGLVPASEGGTTKFLREDGTWVVPSGGGGGTITGTGVAGQVTYWTGTTAISGKASFTFDTTNDILKSSRFNTSLASAPVAAVTNGDFYYNSTSLDFFSRINGHWVNLTRIPERVDSGTTVTITEADRNTIVRCSSNSPVTVTLSLLSTNFAVTVVKSGLGNVTFSTGGNLVGVDSVIQVQHGAVTAYHSGGNTWRLYGTLGLNGGGTVTSVGLTGISGLINVSNSPIATSGDIALSLVTQAPNTFFRGPSSGSASATPTFGSIVVADLPDHPIDIVTGPTYTYSQSDNKRIKVFTNSGGCATTIPLTLTTGWSTLAYRPLTGGGVSFSSLGSMEPTTASLSTPGTMASILHRGGNIHVISGAIGSPGGVDLANGNATIISGNTVNLGNTLINNTVVAGAGFSLNWGNTGSKLTQFNVHASNLINLTSDIGTVIAGPAGYFDDVTNGRRMGLTTLGAVLFLGSDAAGDIYFRSGGGLLSRLPIGTEDQVLTVSSAGFPEWVTPPSGSVSLVSGTTNRITVTDGSSTPVIDISSSYAGQTSITTLGTVATGTWNATTIATTKGGTGLTSIGTANQILGVNNAGTGLEYKTVSTSTTAVSNNIGVTLSGANAIVLNIPDASATVRGVVTTGTQTIAGVKTFSNNLLVGSTTNGAELSSSSGLLTLYSGGSSSTLGGATNHMWLNKILQLSAIYITNSTSGLDTACATITRAGAGSTEHNNRFSNNVGSTGFLFSTSVSSAYGAFAYNMVRINTASGAKYAPSVGGGTFRNLIIDPLYEVTNSGTITGIHYKPNEVSMTGVTHYGLLIESTTAKNGFGTAAPTALVHITGSTTSRSALRINSGVDPTSPNNGDIWHASDHLYVRLNGVTYQLDQQGGGGGTGTVTSFSAGDLAPLFTTSESSVTTTPSLTFSLSNAAANTYFGNATGSSAAPSYTSMEALTKDDSATNLKITLSANASTSLLKAVSITTSWSGALSATQGGTGQTTVTTGDLLYGSASNTWGKLAAAASNNVLLSGTTPSWGKVPIAAIANISTARILGRVDALTGVVQELTGTQATTLLDVFTTSVKGLVPAATGGNTTTQFLRKDGTWAVPSGGGGITNSANNLELMMSDGTNAISSGVYADGNGNIELGDSSNPFAPRTITAIGSASIIDINISPKGTTAKLVLGSSLSTKYDSGENAYKLEVGKAGDEVKAVITSPNATGGGVLNGRLLEIRAGAAFASSGDGDGGSILIQSGLRRTAGSGTDGNITLDALTGYLILANVPTSSSGLPTGAVWSNSGVLTIV